MCEVPPTCTCIYAPVLADLLSCPYWCRKEIKHAQGMESTILLVLEFAAGEPVPCLTLLRKEIDGFTITDIEAWLVHTATIRSMLQSIG